ncbi:MAG TPA: hypothetical protein VM077_02790 [Candidatus Limnocylindrales bacterium]|nr:hypothetical protein [Candidatus Limnocylindrales bacterium]
MGFLERRISGYREVAEFKRQIPHRAEKPELADPDKFYAEKALEAEGVLHAIVSAVKGHRQRNPQHQVEVDVTTIQNGEGEEKMSPVARIRWRSRDHKSPTGWVKSGVNVVLHDAWDGVVKIIHSVHPYNQGQSNPVGVWKNFEASGDNADTPLDEQIGSAMSEASGDDPNMLKLLKGKTGRQIGPGKK